MVSVIICTYNRSKLLKISLNSLAKQKDTDGLEYEIIIVDNNSSDDTKETVDFYKQKFNSKLKYVFEPKQGLSHARNRGVQKAQYEVLAFTDDDLVVDERWIANIAQFAQKHDFDAMGGRILPTYLTNTPQWIKDNQDLLNGPIVSHNYGEEVRLYTDSMTPFVGANMVIKKKMFDELGPFRPDIGLGAGKMGEDTEYFFRLKNAGKRIYYCGKSLVWHEAENDRMNLKYIAQWNIGAGRFYASIKEQVMGNERLVYYFGIPRYLLRKIFVSGLGVLFNVFRKREFLKAWNRMFVSLGMILEFRKQYRLQKTV